jgi:tRNA G18 (ribose-2'-O)-methylase SpoU
MLKMDAKELRLTQSTPDQKMLIKKNQVYIIVDNVLDTYNIGAIFRLADAVAASCIFLCGMTETPPNSRIKKASINTTEWVDWEYFDTAVDAIKKLREQVPAIKIYAVEQDSKSVPYTSINYTFPIALMVGHETTGVTREALGLSDAIVELPMWGINKSLNVMVSLAIVLFEAVRDN